MNREVSRIGCGVEGACNEGFHTGKSIVDAIDFECMHDGRQRTEAEERSERETERSKHVREWYGLVGQVTDGRGI